MTNSSQDTTRTEVFSYSQNWIKNFSLGNAEASIAAYHSKAVMWPFPYRNLLGEGAIAGLWKPFIASGAKDLVYQEGVNRSRQ